MSVTALVFVVASALYTGFQWTISVVVYPQFSRVGPEDFVAYERRHQHLVSIAVGPLFVLLGLSALALLVHPPHDGPRWVAVTAVLLVGVVLVTTALAAVPLHRQLSSGYDAEAHRRLRAVDSVRLAAAATSTALGVVTLAGSI